MVDENFFSVIIFSTNGIEMQISLPVFSSGFFDYTGLLITLSQDGALSLVQFTLYRMSSTSTISLVDSNTPFLVI